jgi:Uma2 family endonuclease
VSLSKGKKYTVDDIYSLPDGERAELIDGEIYMMATPGRVHQEISMVLSTKIRNYIDDKNGGCKVYAAPFSVFINEDDINYVEPDISVICDKNKLTDKGCVGAPDWVIEIVSPSSLKMDYMIKLFKYREAGVKEYWIVDPKDKIVYVYDFANDNMVKYTFDDKVKVNIYDDLEIDFSVFTNDLK